MPFEFDPTQAWRLLPDTLAEKCSDGKWKPYPHLIYLSQILTDRIARGNARIIVNMPPRAGKSNFISQWFPIWHLENWPDKKVIITTYEATFAESWGRKVRDEFELNPILTTKINPRTRAARSFETTAGGTINTAGVGGPITGKGGHLIIIDDPIKNEQEAFSETIRQRQKDWYESTLSTRTEPGASIILLMTRWHEDDLAGYLISTGEFEVIKLPALAEENDPLGRKFDEPLCAERMDFESLDKRRKRSIRWFNAMYQQRPAMAEGEIFKRSDWQRYTELPEKFDEVIQSWDMTFKDAKSSDYVVGYVMARKGPHIYVLAEYRGQWSFSKTCEMVKKASMDYPKARKKLIENKANGPAIENNLKSAISGIKLVEPQGGKIARANAAEPTVSSQHVHLPKDFDWAEGLIEEAASFPKGKHDDRVDALSQGINYLDKKANSSLFQLGQR